MTVNDNSLNWFEIPATDIARAKEFYKHIYQLDEMEESSMMGMDMAMFPSDYMLGKVSGALVKSENHKPSTEGSLVYLNGNPDLGQVLDRVEGAGGQVVMPKTQINDTVGFMAFFIDTEGNKIGLHSNN